MLIILEIALHLVSVEKLEPGAVLGRSIYNERGELLLASGYVIDDRVLTLLKDRGFDNVFVLDGIADDIVPQRAISSTLHRSTSLSVRKAHDALKAHPHLKKLDPREIGERLDNDPRLKNLLKLSSFRTTAMNLIEEVMSNNVRMFASLPSRSNASQEFEHAVDVAILCALMGQHLGLDRDELRTLVTAALLHDVGKFVLPTEEQLSERSSKLEMKSLYREHPTYSMLLLRGSDPGSFREQLAVHHHHERLDGSGYPLQLKGEDIPPSRKTQGESRGIYRQAMILAVANRYDNLISGRVDNIRHTPEQALEELVKDAGIAWNSHAVRALTRIVQIFPVGCRVRVNASDTEEIRGFFGVVISNNENYPARPTVIITHDGMNRPVEPKKINFALDKRCQLELVL